MFSDYTMCVCGHFRVHDFRLIAMHMFTEIYFLSDKTYNHIFFDFYAKSSLLIILMILMNTI